MLETLLETESNFYRAGIYCREEVKLIRAERTLGAVAVSGYKGRKPVQTRWTGFPVSWLASDALLPYSSWLVCFMVKFGLSWKPFRFLLTVVIIFRKILASEAGGSADQVQLHGCPFL